MTTKNTNDLKCLFCGGNTTFDIGYEHSYIGGTDTGITLSCDNCPAEMSTSYGKNCTETTIESAKEFLTKSWNNRQSNSMNEGQIKRLLYTIYNAGFDHGMNEGAFPKTGTFDAFERLIIGESPLNDGISYDIKEKVEKLMSK